MDVVLWEHDLYFLAAQPVKSDRSPPFSPSSMENLLQNDRSPKESDQLPLLVLRTWRTCFKMTGRQRKMTSYLHAVKLKKRKLNQGIEPTYQLPERKNRGKPQVQYEADLKAKGKYPINNYISLNRLSVAHAHFVKP
ncbi:unnamed protein product [Prunus armeniaca]